ncbi:MAG: hypothetical protein JSR19_10215 [Proteobacteria bacterium]|nr:hypothetical protein [Pseudomonadota bacterium]HQR03241.1 hypothetical protein [Rhodocyclaceae bacterium]
MDRRTLLQIFATLGLARVDTSMAAGIDPRRQGLVRIKGEVRINGTPARTGQDVHAGDRIITGADGEAVYVIGQNAFLQRSGTEIHFDLDPATFFRLVSGRLLSVFGKGPRYLALPTATIGIRGTACYIETTAMKTYFCLCYGTADVVPTIDPAQRETIQTHHHDHPIYINADPSMTTSMVPAEVMNHTDAELEMLENLVGRKPPFDINLPGHY